MLKKIFIVVTYCLPAMAALVIALWSYHGRVMHVGETIHFYQKAVEQANAENQFDEKLLSGITDDNVKQLISDLERKVIEKRVDLNGQAEGLGQAGRDSIDQVVFEIWLSNSSFVSALVLLPFLLFGVVLAGSKRLQQTQDERLTSAAKNVIMKFAVATVMCIGWIYILNPQGRGAGTIANYLIAVDLTQKDTLPLYIKSAILAPAVAAFLGWYLHMLSYFFEKIINHDVVSPYVYNHLFKKFLFVYGISVVLSSTAIVPEGQMSVAMFLLGYFPLAAFSLMKDQLAKYTGNKQTEGLLTMIPGISRWQILRLEEEGVESMADLATSNSAKLKSAIPGMSCLLDYWIDVARLYAIVGEEAFTALRGRCMTASGFVRLSEDQAFKDFMTENKVGDADEVRASLQLTFSRDKGC